MPVYSFKVAVFYRMVKLAVAGWGVGLEIRSSPSFLLFSACRGSEAFCFITHNYNLTLCSEHLQDPGMICHLFVLLSVKLEV